MLYMEMLREVNIEGLYKELELLTDEIRELQYQQRDDPQFCHGEELADLMNDREDVKSEIRSRGIEI